MTEAYKKHEQYKLKVVKLVKKLFAVLLILTLFMPYTIKTADALSCVIPDVEESMAYSDGVVIAKVLKVKETFSARLITVEVEKSYKGVEQSTLTFSEDLMWGSSALSSSYLLFLNRDKDKWSLPLCSGLLLSFAKENQLLDALEQYPLIELTDNEDHKDNDDDREVTLLERHEEVDENTVVNQTPTLEQKLSEIKISKELPLLASTKLASDTQSKNTMIIVISAVCLVLLLAGLLFYLLKLKKQK